MLPGPLRPTPPWPIIVRCRTKSKGGHHESHAGRKPKKTAAPLSKPRADCSANTVSRASALRELMGAAGLTHGGFYKQFASKDDLVAEACDRALDAGVDKWRRIVGEASAARRRSAGRAGAPLPGLLATAAASAKAARWPASGRTPCATTPRCAGASSAAVAGQHAGVLEQAMPDRQRRRGPGRPVDDGRRPAAVAHGRRRRPRPPHPRRGQRQPAGPRSEVAATQADHEDTDARPTTGAPDGRARHPLWLGGRRRSPFDRAVFGGGARPARRAAAAAEPRIRLERRPDLDARWPCASRCSG